MRRVELEVVLGREQSGRLLEHVGGDVQDGAAYPALGVRVGPDRPDEVVCRAPVPEVDVLDDAQPLEGFQRAVDAGQVNRWVGGGDQLSDLLDAQVPRRAGEHPQDGPARAGHPLAAHAQTLGDGGQREFGGVRCGHGPIVPAGGVCRAPGA